MGVSCLAGCATSAPPETRENLAIAERPTAKQIPSPSKATGDDAAGKSTAAIKQEVIADESIFFSLGSSTITPGEQEKIETIAELLREDKNLLVKLIGHANDNGSLSFNLAVSDGRVMAVAEQLRKNGVQVIQIRSEALGSEQTPSNCRSAECRRKFSRVELIVVKGRPMQRDTDQARSLK